MKSKGILPILVLYSIFPLTFILGKTGFCFGPPILFVSLRMILSGIVLLGFYSISSGKAPLVKSTDWFLVAQGSIVGIFFGYAPEFWALKYLSAAKVAFLLILAPFFSFIFEFFQDKESMTLKKFLGMGVAFCGVIPMLLPSEVYQHTFTPPIDPLYLEFLVMACVASYAFGWFSVKTLTHKKEYPISLISGLNMFIGGVLCFILSLFTETSSHWGFLVSHWYYYSFYIALISIVGILCFYLYILLLRHYSATFVSATGFIEPFFAAFYGWIFLGEAVSWIFFLATGIVGAGLYIFYLEELRINPRK